MFVVVYYDILEIENEVSYMARILVVDDDKNTRRLISVSLNKNNDILLATNGIEAVKLFEQNVVDLLIIDVMMPQMDGYELTKLLRETNNNNPILMLTSKHAIMDKQKGYSLGIDDYLTKPFDPIELQLRVDALLRRAKVSNQHLLTIHTISLNKRSLEVTTPKEIMLLPKKEFDLLFKLLSYPNIIFTKYQLMDEIWGITNESDDHTINVHINRLRNRFAQYDDFEILTIRGLGFKAVIKK